MAVKNKILHNSKTGQVIRFLQTSKDTEGKLLEMETTYAPFSTEPPPHYHPLQDEYFTVLDGQVNVRIGGQIRQLNPGDKLHIPPNTVHSMWNASPAPLTVNWQLQPAMETEYFFETLNAFADLGRSNASGRPVMPQLALTMRRFRNEFRLAKPPYPLQKVLFSFFGVIGTIKGYRGIYKEYLD